MKRSPSALRAILTAAVFAAGSALGATARAQVIDIPNVVIGPPPLTGDQAVAGKRAFWRAGKERWFFAATEEIGNFYLRTSGAVGYGRPHWIWAGIEGTSALSPNGGVLYGGLHAAWQWLDLRAGARYTFTAKQHFLSPRATFTKDETENTSGPKERYLALEAEAASSVSVPGGALTGLVGLYHPLGTPEGYHLFDQALQLIAAPGLSWRARAGYLARVDRWDFFRAGPVAEVLGNVPRGLVVVRAGPTISALITHHLEAYAAALLVVHSGDALGLAGGQLGEVGFRYRWATGDRWPEIP